MTGLNYKLILLAVIVNFSLNCSSPTQPPVNPPPPPPAGEPDSTTQDFTFQTYEFGDGYSSSYLNDVWIFNANNIWAVGWISPTDTTVDGYNITNPNIIKWDGSQWKIQHFSGTSSGIYGIWAADSSNIYFAIGNVLEYHNGTYKDIVIQGNWSQGQGVHKLWGSSTSNIWGVGPWGTIVHYDGSQWTKIDFDRRWYFYGITGDPTTGVGYAYARDNSSLRIIVQLSNSTAAIIHQSQQITAVKANAMKFIDSTLYLAGSDFTSTLIWKFNPQTKRIDSLFTTVPTTGLYQATGNNRIDYYFWGDDYGTGKMIHYNGKRFKEFDLPKAGDNSGGACTNGDVSAFVGFSNNKGYITIVKRK